MHHQKIVTLSSPMTLFAVSLNFMVKAAARGKMIGHSVHIICNYEYNYIPLTEVYRGRDTGGRGREGGQLPPHF